MTRRKELTNIGSGVLGSFLSRNNDVDGYWGIGRIWLSAQKEGQTDVRISLSKKTISLSSPEFAGMVESYADFLRAKVLKRRLNEDTIQDANLILNFDPKSIRASWYTPAVPEIKYEASIQLKSDLGRLYEVKSTGWCRPHNPEFEHRSARIEK